MVSGGAWIPVSNIGGKTSIIIMLSMILNKDSTAESGSGSGSGSGSIRDNSSSHDSKNTKHIELLSNFYGLVDGRILFGPLRS